MSDDPKDAVPDGRDVATKQQKSLSKEQLNALAAFCGESMKGGKVVRSSVYEDHAGNSRHKALVDFGIAGIKSFDAGEYELAVAAGEVEPTLEMLDMSKLKQIADDLGVGVQSGRPNPVKLIVAIRAKLEADAISELEAESEGSTRSEVINAYGEKVGQLLIDAGYASLSAVAEADDEDLLSISGIGKGTLKALRAFD
jgi:hypothetical protein